MAKVAHFEGVLKFNDFVCKTFLNLEG